MKNGALGEANFFNRELFLLLLQLMNSFRTVLFRFCYELFINKSMSTYINYGGFLEGEYGLK
jgi:hypothetical protein